MNADESRKPVILAVDDEPGFLTVLTGRLKAAGCRVYSASTVEGALQILATEECDGAVLDVRMPRMTGLELAERIELLAKPNAPKFPIWLITARPSVAIHNRASELGIRNVFVKPFEWVPVLEEIMTVLHSRNSGTP